MLDWRSEKRSMLDPDIRRLLDTVFAVPMSTTAPDIAALRATVEEAPKRLGGEPEAVASVEDATVPGPARVRARIYRPHAKAPLPLVLYAHGGGWVTGSLDSHDRVCRCFARRLPAVFVAVDYRRAPEHVYPAALDDVEAAWRWASEQATALGADGVRYAVAGDSSGGNLAAALTLRLRAAGKPQPALQLLLYPALDAECARPSYRRFTTGYNLAAEQMKWYWDVYRADADAEAPELSPLAAPDLSGLPPAVVAIAEADVLRDDGFDYARRLEASGIPVRIIDCAGMIHGFLRWTGEVPAARAWIDEIARAAREMLDRRREREAVR
jgi:acetyl esterase